MMVGDYYLHDNKSKSSEVTAAMASRYVSSIKRMVIYGATTHTYAQGLKRGVPKKVLVACIKDLQSYVQNMIGESSTMDACDGAGLTNPYYSRMENASLLDAAVKGGCKKTIMHDIDHRGCPKLLKWAEYDITNMKRRNSWASDVPYERIFKKMNSVPVILTHPEYIKPSETNSFTPKTFENVYYSDANGNYYKATIEIARINNLNYAVKYVTPVDANGNSVGETYREGPIKFDTLYELDQIFGGA
jgi:hypothetical protein